MNYRIVNIRYKVKELLFDAAVDCDHILYGQSYGYGESNKHVDIELECLSKPDWDIKVITLNANNIQGVSETLLINDQQDEKKQMILQTFIDFDYIYKATLKWIEEMKE